MKLTFLTLLGLVVSLSVWSKTTSYEFNYHSAQTMTGDDSYDRIFVDELPQSIDADKPVLPFEMVRLLLPRNSELKNVTVTRLEDEVIPTPSKLAMAKTKRSFSEFTTNVDYPSALTYKTVQKLHNYQVVLAKINPVYIDKKGTIHFARKLKIEVSYEESKEVSFASPQSFLNHSDEVAKFVSEKSLPVMNSYLDNSFIYDKSGPNDYDYLIITSQELMAYTGPNSLSTFKNFLETGRNLKVKIVDGKMAEATQTGRDRAEKLRNFIKSEYTNYNPKYLLLVGDTTDTGGIIPARRFYSEVKGYDGTSWKLLKENIVSDFYYGCLDGTFDGNANGKWGEIKDGENGGDVDFVCELNVGRWPVEKTTELANVVSKTLQAYQLSSRAKTVLLMGEELFANKNLWGGDYMDKLVGIVNDHGFISKGYDSSWNITKMYDTKQKSWSGTQAKSTISSGDFLMINHLGHSNTTSNMRLSTYNNQLSNKLPFFYYTQGCFPGYFVANDSFIEQWVYAANGPFAAVANSNYGLGPEDPDASTTTSPGTSEILHRFFVNRVLGTESYLAFGEAHQKSKEDLLIYINHPEARWVIWETTFFGDPAIRP